MRETHPEIGKLKQNRNAGPWLSTTTWAHLCAPQCGIDAIPKQPPGLRLTITSPGSHLSRP